jgi:hypothetical protein
LAAGAQARGTPQVKRVRPLGPAFVLTSPLLSGQPKKLYQEEKRAKAVQGLQRSQKSKNLWYINYYIH